MAERKEVRFVIRLVVRYRGVRIVPVPYPAVPLRTRTGLATVATVLICIDTESSA